MNERLIFDLLNSIVSPHVAGATVGLSTPYGEFYAGIGVANVDQLPATPTELTLFRVGSITKCFTAVAVMRAVEAGLIELDEPVLPHFKLAANEYHRLFERITVRMLLSHTAGLPPYANYFCKSFPKALESFVRQEIPRIVPQPQPGRAMQYSNFGYCILGFLLERVFSKSYEAVINEFVIAPLVLRRTTFQPAAAKAFPLAIDHRRIDGVLRPNNVPIDDARYYPAGFLYSTSYDTLKFGKMILGHGKSSSSRILSRDLVREMCSVHSLPYLSSLSAYGLGWELSQDSQPARVEHHGSIGTYQSLLSIVPEEGIVLTIHANGPGRVGLLGEYRDRLLDRILPSKRAVKPFTSEPKAVLKNRFMIVGTFLGECCGIVQIESLADSCSVTWNGEAINVTEVRDGLLVGCSAESGVTLELGIFDGSPCAEYILVNGVCAQRIIGVPSEIRDTKWEEACGIYESQIATFEIRHGTRSQLVILDEYDNSFPARKLGQSVLVSSFGVLRFAPGLDSLRIGTTEFVRRPNTNQKLPVGLVD